MTEYYYDTQCHVDFIQSMFVPKLPEYVCKDRYLSYIPEPVELVNHFNPTVEMYVGILFVLAIGLFGSAIVELLHNKIDWYLYPLVNYVEKRYNYVQERNRLESMNGHP